MNRVPYLRTSREFPEDLHELSVEVNKSYLDIANAVNNRTISIFPTNRPAVGGESWYFTSKREQNLRQIYPFTTTARISHGISFNSVTQFTKPTGSFTDGTNWYGVIYGSSVAIAGQLSFYITPTQIVFLSGAGVPTLITGTIVLEWITNP